MTRITVLRDRYTRSWPQLAPDKPLRPSDRCYPLDLSVALEREFSTDAHFVAYSSPNGHRLNVEAINQGIEVVLKCVVFDVVCPETHGTKAPAPESWRRELRAKVQTLAEQHPDPFYYETRGGSRICYRQLEPTVLRTQADAQAWTDHYSVAISHIKRAFGIEADPACADWQRLFRLPRATREPGGNPENWPSWGSVDRIGAFMIRASEADVRLAKAKLNAFQDRGRGRAFLPSIASGEGLFFHLLRARGDVSDRKCSRGGLVVRCPNRAQHTKNTDGTDSTVLYPPRADAELGVIHCKHGHCRHLTVTQWLRFFGDRELSAARAAAGIQERRGHSANA